MQHLLLSLLLCLLLSPGAALARTSSDATAIHADYVARLHTPPCDQLARLLPAKMTPEERQAIEFLYAYMPLPDMADRPATYWMRHVKTTLQARRDMPWGQKVSDELWRHFVLPARVNNEALDDFRPEKYDELRRRVAGLSMSEAAIEVNHWCHEHVTYQPSDARTSSPLATLRTGHGRCGEESTLTVAALRAVGLPARQVYTPRWAHTDDNHAWVEVWVDGAWHFMGACEPEAVLDLGWFNAPASRAMLMHTKVFGRYTGPETVMSRTACFTEIAVTHNYAATAMATARVVDAQGRPVEGARVMYKVYNYAEFYTVATLRSDARGLTSLPAGLGDMLVWATDGTRYGLQKLAVASGDTAVVALTRREGEAWAASFDITPPKEHAVVPPQTDEQMARNKQRLASEDAMRLARQQTFHRTDSLTQRAEGNWEVIETFLASHPDRRARLLLGALTAKDLRDVTPDVLADHYALGPAVATPFEARYRLSPRIFYEQLTPFRSQLRAIEAFRRLKSEADLIAFTRRELTIDGTWNPQQLVMSPAQVMTTRVCDARSRDVFFVAAARTMGLTARIDEVTERVELWRGDHWEAVALDDSAALPATEGTAAAPRGTLQATYTPAAHTDNPQYYTHFTLSRLDGGEPVLLNYPEEGCTYESLLRPGEPLDAATYIVTTGTRLASGAVLAHVEAVVVNPDDTTRMALRLRERQGEVQVIGQLNAEHVYTDATQGPKTMLSTTGRGYYVVGLIRPGHEPSNHALRDIAARREALEAWGRPILLLFASDDERQRYLQGTTIGGLPATVVWGVDEGQTIGAELSASLKLTPGEQPVFVIADTFNRVVFLSQGYTIGLGDQLVGVARSVGQ